MLCGIQSRRDLGKSLCERYPEKPRTLEIYAYNDVPSFTRLPILLVVTSFTRVCGRSLDKPLKVTRAKKAIAVH